MRCLTLALGFALIAALGLTVASQSLPPPERMLTQPWNCTGWPEPRVWIEAQQWWTDAGEEADIEHTSRHFHIGACMPYGQTLSGVVTIDVLTQLHNNQDHYISEVYFLAPLPYNATGIITDIDNHKIGTTGPVVWNCSADSLFPHTCMKVWRIEVDTTRVPVDGFAPLRLRMDCPLKPGLPADLTKGNGYTYVPELSVKVNYANGKPALPKRVDSDFLPQTPTIGSAFNDFPWSYTRLSVFNDRIPMSPISGMYTFRGLESFDQRFENRVDPVVTPVTRSFITLNPRFHLVTNGTFTPDSGTVQLDVPNMIYHNLEIDTTLLPNGRNILFFRTDSTLPAGAILPDTIPWLPGVTHAFTGGVPHPGGTNSAVLVFAFFVNNPRPPPALAPATSTSPTNY